MSGGLGSLGASVLGLVAGDFASSAGGIIAFGAISGGIGAELSDSNFWEGVVIGGIVAGLNHAMHSEQAQPDPPQEDDWVTKLINAFSGGAIDEARAILAFEATNPSFGEKMIFRTGLSLQNSTAETFGAKGLGAWGNYRGSALTVNNKGGKYLFNSWHKGTFPNKTQSVMYHYRKHGNGRTAVQYTKDAMKFFNKNKGLGQKVILKGGTQGIKIQTKQIINGKTQRSGGYWTSSGKIVTFWD